MSPGITQVFNTCQDPKIQWSTESESLFTVTKLQAIQTIVHEVIIGKRFL